MEFYTETLKPAVQKPKETINSFLSFQPQKLLQIEILIMEFFSFV